MFQIVSTCNYVNYDLTISPNCRRRRHHHPFITHNQWRMQRGDAIGSDRPSISLHLMWYILNKIAV